LIFVTHRVGRVPPEAHGNKRKDLEDVILNHVADHTGALVVGATALDANGLRVGDLNVIDVLAIPDGLKDAIGKSKDHQVLNRLLAEIVVDSIDLIFVKGISQFC
jgi:hypothetical protein